MTGVGTTIFVSSRDGTTSLGIKEGDVESVEEESPDGRYFEEMDKER